MTRFYRLALVFACLCFSFHAFAQVPLPEDDTPPPTDEDTPTTFNVTDNDVDLLFGIDEATVDLDLTQGGIQDTFTSPEGDWQVDDNGNVTFTPLLNFSGDATIPYTVQNESIIPITSAPADITVTVTEVNDDPTITDVADQAIAVNTNTGALAFTVADVETAPGTLNVTGTSDNITLVPNANIAFAGTGADRTVTVTPAVNQTGVANITITLDDGTTTVATAFQLDVSNTAPTISAITDQSTPQGTATSPIAFTVGDAETAAGTLTVSATSSNTTLVPVANIVFGGSGANRTVTITPAAGQSGTSTITVTVSDGTDDTPTSFTLTVTAPNTPPTISAITDQSTLQGTATSPIAFTVGDAETAAGTLTVSATSSNTTLVPVANIVFGGSGANRTVTITPAAGQSGTSTITVTVSDGTDDTPTSFTLTVTAPNTPPTISAITDQSTPQGTATSPIAFTVGDAETAAGTLTVSATSSNTTLVPVANIVFGGSGANRTVTITPAAGQSGTSTITVTVSDGTDDTPTSFTLTVTAPNTPPTISAITDQSTPQGTATSPIAFTVGDAETAAGTLTVSATSSNTTLVPVANIVFGGSGANRTVTITPAAGQSGTSTITVTVSDGTDGTPTTFTLTVTAPNTPPTISAITDQSTPQGTATSPIAFTVGDAETAAGTLTVSATSSNTTLVPVANIVFGGSGANRTVTITPAAGQSGTSTITVTVSDGTDDTPTSFTLTVTAPNTAPTISAITDQTTPENTPTSAIAFTVGDAESPVAGLTVTATSSNVTLVPNANIAFGGSGANRTLTITPVAGQTGTSTITVTVSDGTDDTSTSFTLTVDAVNDAPTISAIGNQSTTESTPTGAIAFTVGDSDNAVGTLTVTGTSSNATLVPDANITFGGSGADRTVTLTPVAGQSGTATITLTVSDGTATASTNFVLTVNNVNDPPTISAISDQTTPENSPTAAIPFTVGDAETAPGSLTVTAASSNTSLVPVANITFGGSGANRTVTINPGASQSGAVTITITVSDGTASASTAFTLTIDPINDAPTVTPISDQTTAENTPTGAIPFNIGDAETPASNLLVSATSSVTTLVSNGNISIGGTGSDRTITITPTAGQSGTTDITINVSDGTTVTSTTFTLTVSSVEDAPTITAISDQTTTEDVATAALPFTIGDPDTPATDLTVTGTSSNKTLVPDANILLFGDNISRTVTITPAANQSGTTTITLTVSDGTASATTSFVLTVTPVNDPPVISAIADQTTAENTATGAIAFTVTDVDSPPASLVVTGTSSNTAVIPNAGIVPGGSGENRTVVITPAAGQSGSSTITLTVSDGTATGSGSFVLAVTSVNDAPTITAIPAQSTPEDTRTGAINFTINDTDSPVTSLTVSGTSSDKTLVADADIAISTSGANRTVTIEPIANKNGITTITLTVSDGTATAQTTFQLTVTPVEDPPRITAQVPLSIPEDTQITLLPAHFTIVDPDGGTFSIAAFPGGENYTVSNGTTIIPRENFDGELFVGVRASDGNLQSPVFEAKITVTDVNLPPVIVSQTEEIRVPVNVTVSNIRPFLEVQDPDNDQSEIVMATILPGAGYVVDGTTITPTDVGPLEVPVTVTDGKAVSAPFNLKIEVFLPGAIPSINGQQSLIIDEDESYVLEFEDLSVSDTDDDYPTGFTMSIAGGENYTVDNQLITPALNYTGPLTIPVTVNDGETNSNTYTVIIYVVPVDDKPQITVLETTALAYEPGSGPVPITEIFECDDLDDNFLSLAEIKLIDSLFSPDNDELIYEGTEVPHIRGVYDASQGVLSLIGYASEEEYITAIRSVKYNYRLTTDVNGEPSEISTEPKQLSFMVSDGPLNSDPAFRAIELETSSELSIPNTFTPNGDISNDTWAVQPFTPTDQFNNTVVKVYNKRGLLVYESVGLDRAWDGTFNGELLPVDTYYYTIDLKLSFTKKSYKGAVMILY